ncbi:hypothetical protein FVP74_01965 [Microbacterium saccharophilum]|uniref:Uncharacterized protein n=1 Tax=Microbacterium saccharophilum TaxID=1213358 RepID=A0A5C8I945_9MICO|nr:hypothetical protein FVP74_01965 [Microbacterium saccharophilum]
MSGHGEPAPLVGCRDRRITRTVSDGGAGPSASTGPAFGETLVSCRNRCEPYLGRGTTPLAGLVWSLPLPRWSPLRPCPCRPVRPRSPNRPPRRRRLRSPRRRPRRRPRRPRRSRRPTPKRRNAPAAVIPARWRTASRSASPASSASRSAREAIRRASSASSSSSQEPATRPDSAWSTNRIRSWTPRGVSR